MLALSRLDGIPVYTATTPEVLTSYSYARLVRGIPDQGRSAQGTPYSIALLVELLFRLRGEWENGTGYNVLDLYERRGAPGAAAMSYREAFELMVTAGYRIGPATYYAQGYVRIAGVEQLKRYIVANGPVVVGLPVYKAASPVFWKGAGTPDGYHGICCVGYNAQGMELVNTRGPLWGNNGRTMLYWDDFAVIREIWGLIV